MVSHLTAERANTREHTLHNDGQNIGADVGLGKQGDLLWCAHLDEGVKHVAAKRVIDTRNKLTIRKGACPACTKLNVGVRIEPPLGTQSVGGAFSRAATERVAISS